MDVRSKLSIQEHLRKEDVQERILQNIHKGRDEATVTISRAAELFGITENKLRDWEEYGFLNPLRPGGPKGRRLYTPTELDKLAIIRELIDAGYAASDIPPDIAKVWQGIRAITGSNENTDNLNPSVEPSLLSDILPIDLRIEQSERTIFWRYFVTHILRLILMLICEDIPSTKIGLLLPLNIPDQPKLLQRVEEAESLGETFVGWLGTNRTIHTFLTARPSFQYTTDFRIEPLRIMRAGVPQEEEQISYPIYIIIQRDARPLTLNNETVETIHSLLRPIHTYKQLLYHSFGPAMRDDIELMGNLEQNSHGEEYILNGLTNIAVELGGYLEDNQPRWQFSCLYLPDDPDTILSLQQRRLIVRAQSEHSPYVIGSTRLYPQEPFICSSIRAYQSGYMIYLPLITGEDTSEHHDQQATTTIRSSIAIPIAGRDGIAIAVLYVASEYPNAFQANDQRILRLVGRLVKECIETYQAHQHAITQLRQIIGRPGLVDQQFNEFYTENEFIYHVEDIIRTIQIRRADLSNRSVSFIAIDIDNQSSIAHKYGDRIAQDISRAAGLRIHSQLRAFKDESEYKLYHICADRFYILLDGMPLDEARAKATLLKQVLDGSYQIEPLHTPGGQTPLSENMITITNVTMRIGISSYTYTKIKEIVDRSSSPQSTQEARRQISGFLETVLLLGKQKGGNIILSWDPLNKGFITVD
ncbi:MAG TPA: MerR family transcriptional regulator [Dictyobacter sp.]|jgi:GGDEF domain-containing protein|nr:MerR family transcriptional regulator [Dictyobacter sp.]